jgi:hypothetical protein
MTALFLFLFSNLFQAALNYTQNKYSKFNIYVRCLFFLTQAGWVDKSHRLPCFMFVSRLFPAPLVGIYISMLSLYPNINEDRHEQKNQTQFVRINRKMNFQ